MMVCDKCKTRVSEDRQPFEALIKICKGKTDVTHVALVESVLCDECANSIGQSTFDAFADFFGGKENLDLRITPKEGDIRWGGKFEKWTPVLDNVHPVVDAAGE